MLLISDKNTAIILGAIALVATHVLKFLNKLRKRKEVPDFPEQFITFSQKIK